MTSNNSPFYEIRDVLQKYNNPIQVVLDTELEQEENFDVRKYLMQQLNRGNWITIWGGDGVSITNTKGHCNYVYLNVCF
jgi:hypothetical protein